MVGPVPTSPKGQRKSAINHFHHPIDTWYYQARPSGYDDGSFKPTHLKRPVHDDYSTHPLSYHHNSGDVPSVDGSCQKRRKIGRDSYLGAESTSNIKPTEDAYRPSSSSWSAIGRRDDPVPDHGDATRQCIIPVSKIKIEPVFIGDGCNDFDRSQMAPDRQPLWRVPNEEAGLHSETNSSQRAFQQDLTARGAPTSGKISKEGSTPDPRSPLRGRQSSQGGGFRGRGESPGLFVPEGSSSLDPSMSDDDENDPGLLSNDGGSMSPDRKSVV